MEIDEGAQVAYLKMRDDNASWMPFYFIHKLVKPTWEELGWINPNPPKAESTEEDDVSEVKELQKIFWIFNCTVYDELRKQEGCETLTDLKATTTDCEDIVKMAKGLGVPDEYIFRSEEPTQAVMRKTYMDIYKLSKKMTAKK